MVGKYREDDDEEEEDLIQGTEGADYGDESFDLNEEEAML